MNSTKAIRTVSVMMSVLAIGSIQEAAAFLPPDKALTPGYDKRESAMTTVRADAVREQAAAALKKRAPGVRIDYDERTVAVQLTFRPGDWKLQTRCGGMFQGDSQNP